MCLSIPLGDNIEGCLLVKWKQNPARWRQEWRTKTDSTRFHREREVLGGARKPLSCAIVLDQGKEQNPRSPVPTPGPVLDRDPRR